MTDTNSEDAQILKIGDTQRAVIAAMFCLGMYEYLVTFDREIRLVWRRRFTATTALFMALRAIMILGPFVNWVPPSSDFSRSMASSMIALALALLGLALFALFSALRVHALWHGSQMQWAFSATVFVLAFVPVVTNIADTVYVAYSLPPSLREAYFCNRIVGLSPKLSENDIPYTELRHCHGPTGLGAHVDQVLPPLSRHAHAGDQIFGSDGATPRRYCVLYCPPCNQRHASGDVVDPCSSGLCNRRHHFAVHSYGAHPALHAKSAATQLRI
ncbi:hypothetical protein PsYK624_169320 [Phanerochaete sordida]|uniref:DUF6533 domain-containing protein n=1 Tax=Phanerochaete sordida TaxID=48140 RepID=A0A9P3GRP4_9APHY|nr:hypothetical protein PsYK624_169320 [Phanerochaete sordida]